MEGFVTSRRRLAILTIKKGKIMNKKIITFDIEIKNKVPDKDVQNDPNFAYCEGWNDKEGMGISFLGAHRSWDEQIEFFDESNLPEFITMIKDADIVTGFNIFGFDTPLLKATLKRLGQDESTGMAGKCYDIFHDIKKSLNFKNIKGWNLDNTASSTIHITKNGDGAMAPDLWQQGKYAELINYLSQDVRVEASLFKHIWNEGYVCNNELEITALPLLGIDKFKDEGSEK